MNFTVRSAWKELALVPFCCIGSLVMPSKQTLLPVLLAFGQTDRLKSPHLELVP